MPIILSGTAFLHFLGLHGAFSFIGKVFYILNQNLESIEYY